MVVVMHPLEQTLSVVGPIVGAIMVLTIFFKVVASLGRPVRSVAFRGVVDDRTRVTVHFTNGTTLKDVRLIGFTDDRPAKGPFPFELQAMVILEAADGTRILVQAKLIRMIEIPPRVD